MKDKLAALWQWAGKKLVVALAGAVAIALQQRHPDWPLPTPEFTRDLTLAFLACHTATDIVAVVKTAGQEYLAGRAQAPQVK